MAIQKAKKTLGLSAEQLAERIGCSVTVAGAVIEQLGGVSEDGVDIARELAATMGGSSGVVSVPAAVESGPVPVAAQRQPVQANPVATVDGIGQGLNALYVQTYQNALTEKVKEQALRDAEAAVGHILAGQSALSQGLQRTFTAQGEAATRFFDQRVRQFEGITLEAEPVVLSLPSGG